MSFSTGKIAEIGLGLPSCFTGHISDAHSVMSQDSLAREIIDRVNDSPYGHKGRKRGGNSAAPRTKPAASSEPKEVKTPPPAHPIQYVSQFFFVDLGNELKSLLLILQPNKRVAGCCHFASQFKGRSTKYAPFRRRILRRNRCCVLFPRNWCKWRTAIRRRCPQGT